MSKLVTVVGVSGVGKTALAQALARAFPFETAYEGHADRPFQALFKADSRYALANQIDYFLFRAEQEKRLRASPRLGLIDGGLDLDLHGFTRLFHKRCLLTDAEFELCQRVYNGLRQVLPPPELIVHLYADERTVVNRLSARDRINIAKAQDTTLFNASINEWLTTISPAHMVALDVSEETLDYERSVNIVLERMQSSLL